MFARCDGQDGEGRRRRRFFRRWSAHRLGSRARRAALGGVAARSSHGQRLVRSVSHAMAPGSACEGGCRRSAGRAVGVETAGAAVVRPDHPVLPRGLRPSTGGMDPSPRRRAHRPALRLMHREPARAWQLGELAKEVAMSRTTFATRFKSIAGVPPLTYLQTCACAMRSTGCAKEPCRYRDWAFPWATRPRARSATHSSAAREWPPSATDPSSRGADRPGSDLGQAAVDEQLHAIDVA